MGITRNDLGQIIATSEQRSQASLSQHHDALMEIQARLDENKRLISDGNTLASRMMDRWTWMKQLASEIKEFMRRVMNSNFAIYREVVAIRALLAAPERPLSEDFFTLDDPIGRIAPIHLRLITSWRAFDAVVEARFENTRGYAKIKRKEYTLNEQGTSLEVDRTTPWDAAFIPGQHINMSLLFRNEVSPGAQGNSTCPFCQASSAQPADSEVQW